MTNSALQNLSAVLVALGLLMAAIAGYGVHYFGKRVEKEQAERASYTGSLRPSSGVILSTKKNVWPKLELGTSGSILAFTGKSGAPLLDFGEGNSLSVVLRDGQIKVSVPIRDKTGHLIAQLIENEWKVNSSNTWDRNFTSDALEVIDATGDVVLQVKALADRIQLQAKLYDLRGRGIAIGTGTGPPGAGGVIEHTSQEKPELTLQIEPIFRYPSSAHFGELVGGT